MVVEAIESVQKQTYEQIEILVIDDGSTDGTEEAVLEVADPRVWYHRLPHQGRSAARNYGVRHARGEYVAFLDSDDLFLPEKVARQVLFLENLREVSFVYTSAIVEHMVPSGERSLLRAPSSYTVEAHCSGNLYSRILLYDNTCPILLSSVMVRKSLFEKSGFFDESMARLEDFDLWRRMSRYTHFQAICEPLVKVRIHSGNTIESPSEFKEAIDRYVRKVFEEESAAAGRNVIREKAAKLYLIEYRYLRTLHSSFNPHCLSFFLTSLWYYFLSCCSHLWQHIRKIGRRMEK